MYLLVIFMVLILIRVSVLGPVMSLFMDLKISDWVGQWVSQSAGHGVGQGVSHGVSHLQSSLWSNVWSVSIIAQLSVNTDVDMAWGYTSDMSLKRHWFNWKLLRGLWFPDPLVSENMFIDMLMHSYGRFWDPCALVLLLKKVAVTQHCLVALRDQATGLSLSRIAITKKLIRQPERGFKMESCSCQYLG